MAQNTDNTWSATEAKENPQEIAKLVSVQKFFFSLFLIVIKFLRHAQYFFIFLEFFFSQVDNLSLQKDGEGKSEDGSSGGVDLAK